jgi:hypothetical protein
MSNLLKDLQKLKPRFPEAQFHVPEWDRPVTLRGFSLREGRELRKGNGEADDERLMLRTLAHAIVDGGDRPLANDDGIALLEGLSAKTVQDMGAAFMKLNGVGEDAEGNSAATAASAGSSTGSRATSGAPSLN